MARKTQAELARMQQRIMLNRSMGGAATCPQWKDGIIPKGVEVTKIIVCGTRTFDNYDYFCKKMIKATFWFDAIEVVIGSHGDKVERNFEMVQIGADGFGKRWAEHHWWKYHTFWPDWLNLGNRAGPIRNTEMAKFVAPEGFCIAFWDGKSRGTQDMIHKFCRYNPESQLRIFRYK